QSEHTGATRPNNPPVGLVDAGTDPPEATPTTYARYPLWDGNTVAVSGGTRVHLVQTAQHRARPDSVDRSGTGALLGLWRLQAHRPVRVVPVVVRGVLGQDRAQVPLVERDEVVQALSSEGADHPFGHRVGPGRPHRREHRLDAQPARPLPEGA